jgi:hypothetical protein
MKRLLGLILFATVLFGLGGCVYDPAYYHRSSVVYDDGAAVYSEPAYYGGYSPYYYEPYGYGYGYGWPWLSLGFYGSYYGGGHHHHYSHGGSHTYHHHH